MGSPHAQENTHLIITPTPAVNLRVDIHFLAQSLAETGGLCVGKEAQQPKQFPVDASGRGFYRRQQGVTQTVSVSVAGIPRGICQPFAKLAATARG